MPNLNTGRYSIINYFADGEPIAARIFANYVEPQGPILVKYGNRQYLEPMLHEGEIRICPASYYNNEMHNAAIQDNEQKRYFYIPTYNERIKGIHHINYNGQRLEINNDDIRLLIEVYDYYLYSLCSHIFYRLPTDFGADAALIIKDPTKFTQLVISNFLAQFPEWKPLCGPVTYYDPYLDYDKFHTPQMEKYFGYTYQREVRFAFLAKQHIKNRLEPIFLKIGPMDEYADLVSA